MLTLHYAPDNASLIIRLALEEAGAPYRTALVDRTLHAQDGAAYRRLAPTGLIPTLETPEGALFETGAILLWLADRFPRAGLAPRPDDAARGRFLCWLFFLANTIHADLRQMFYPDRYVDPAGRAGHRTRLTGRLRGHFALLDTAATTHPALFAPPSALALYAAVLLRWSVLYPAGQAPWFDLASFPSLAACATITEARPAARRAADAEGLGPTPFTRPEPPRPPQGSPT